MTIEIVIPVFEILRAIPYDIQLVLLFGFFGVVFIALSFFFGLPDSAAFLGALFIMIAFACFCHFVAFEVMNAMPEVWPNVTFPINIEVR